MNVVLRRKLAMALLTCVVLVSCTMNIVYSHLLIVERDKREEYRGSQYQPPLGVNERGLSRMEAMKRLSGRRPLPRPDR